MAKSPLEKRIEKNVAEDLESVARMVPSKDSIG